MCDVREGGCVVRYYIWKSYNFFRCGWSSLISRDFFSCPSRRFCRCTFSAGDPRVHLTSSGARRDAAQHTQSADGSQELTDVTADETVSALKTKLYESNLIDVQPTGQRLVFSGRTLGDGEKLATDAGIADGTSWSW